MEVDEKYCASAFFVSAVNFFGDHSGFLTLLSRPMPPASTSSTTTTDPSASAAGSDGGASSGESGCHDRWQWLCDAPPRALDPLLRAMEGVHTFSLSFFVCLCIRSFFLA